MLREVVVWFTNDVFKLGAANFFTSDVFMFGAMNFFTGNVFVFGAMYLFTGDVFRSGTINLIILNITRVEVPPTAPFIRLMGGLVMICSVDRGARCTVQHRSINFYNDIPRTCAQRALTKIAWMQSSASSAPCKTWTSTLTSSLTSEP